MAPARVTRPWLSVSHIKREPVPVSCFRGRATGVTACAQTAQRLFEVTAAPCREFPSESPFLLCHLGLCLVVYSYAASSGFAGRVHWAIAAVCITAEALSDLGEGQGSFHLNSSRSPVAP